MDTSPQAVAETVELLVKQVLMYEGGVAGETTRLSFYADGYPGLMYQDTGRGLTVQPHDKVMPELFLYGQTIQPVELVITGSYHLTVLQLYPFVLRSVFDLAPDSITDGCYDLCGRKEVAATDLVCLICRLRSAKTEEQRVALLSGLLAGLFGRRLEELDEQVRQAIFLLEAESGLVRIREVARRLHTSPRTLERKFLAATGLSPKQFARIVQFSASLRQLRQIESGTLTDIAYDNGFADQSHFIRVFRKFTGITPSFFPE